MLAGRLRHLVTIEQKVSEKNEYNEPIATWVPFASVRAGVEPLQGREYFAADQVQAEVSHRVRMRYRRGVLPTMRIKWDGRVFEIQSVINPREQNRELQLMCKEVV